MFVNSKLRMLYATPFRITVRLTLAKPTNVTLVRLKALST